MDPEPSQNQPATSILVVDDDPHVVQSLALFLEIDGYQVLKAHSLEEAVDRCCNCPVEVVITDLTLADGRSGMELPGLIEAKIETTPHFILLTGQSYATLENEALEAGFEKYLLKPPSLQDLRESIKTLLASACSPDCSAGTAE